MNENAVVGWDGITMDGKELEFKRELLINLSLDFITELSVLITDNYGMSTKKKQQKQQHRKNSMLPKIICN